MLSLLCFNSCEDDIVGEGDVTEIIQEPSLTFDSSVSGIVTNINGQSLEDVEVTYKDKNYLTDENGFFKIENVIAEEDGGILRFEYDDHFTNYKFFIPQTNRRSFMRVQMIQRNLSGQISSSNGGEIILEGGAKLVFPTNAFIDDNNVSYEGEVSVYAHWYNPDTKEFSPSMPGDLRAIDASGQIAQLSTFGMMAVELEASNGRELNIAEGKKAKLEFPIPNALLNNAPEVIETWSLNEETIYWEEEDIATLESGKYITEVSHFSFWNCDAPFPLVNIYGKLINHSGDPLPGHRICIIAFNGAQTGYGWTDTQGGFSGKVPKNQELVMQVKDECGNVVFKENIGPFTTNTSFGEIIVNVSKSLTVFGRLVCNGMPINSGYAKIQLNDWLYYIAEVNGDGLFELPIIQCQITQISVQGFDLENARISDVLNYSVSGKSELDAGDIEVCQELDEYIIYKVNGSQEFLIETPSAKIVDGNLVISSFIDSIESGVNLVAPGAVIGNNGDVSSLNALLFDSTNNLYQFNCNDNGALNCTDVIINITSLGGEGDYVIGDFMGQSIDFNGNTTSVMGSFRIQIDYSGSSRSISGVSWIDVNQDGIRQETEPFLSNVGVTLSSQESFDNFFAETDVNGNYIIDNLCPGDYYMRVSNANGFVVTLQDQGSDDSIDSDVSQQGLDLTLGSLDLTNLDIGFIYHGNLECDYEINTYPGCQDPLGGVVNVHWSGIPPFTFNYFGQGINETVTTSLFSGIMVELAEGNYRVQIIDATGNVCSKEFELMNIDSILCSVVTTPENCGENNGTAFVEVSGQSSQYIFSWSNGENTQRIDNLSPGDYGVTVTDLNGCETECSGFVPSGDLIIDIVSEELECENGVNQYLLTAEVFNGNGQYQFEWSDGQTGQSVIVEAVNQTFFVLVSDLNGNCFAEAIIDLDVAFGEIDGMVWLDDLGGTSDIYDQGLEVGVDSLLVELFSADNLITPMNTTLTNDSGAYHFGFIGPGDYALRFTPINNLIFVSKDIGMNDNIDSDVDPNTGFTDIFTVDGCNPITDVFAGLKEN